MNSPILQEKGQFQLAFKGDEFVNVSTDEILTAKRAVYLSGVYKIRLGGVQATTPWTSMDDTSTSPSSFNNGLPLVLITSPQFTQILTPDLPGPVFQWGTDFFFAPVYTTASTGLNVVRSQCQVGDLLSTHYVAQLHNYIELQLRINDPSQPLGGQNSFIKPLTFAFSDNTVQRMSFIFTFYYERV